MGALAAVSYDPAVAATNSTATLLAMTALDTTNLRVTFTAPASGTVLVRARCATTGGANMPVILMGILQSATVMCRGVPVGGYTQQAAAYDSGNEAYMVVTGLGAGSHTWDLAYAVQSVIASSSISYGGPNDATGNDAWGAIAFSVWDPGPNILAATGYDPSTAASFGTTALKAMTAFDTTNLRLTVTAPGSGNIFWRLRVPYTGASATHPQILLGLLEGATVVARQVPCATITDQAIAAGRNVLDASGVMTGVTGGSHSYDAAYAVQVVSSSGGALKYGGPNTNAGNNAWGQALFELWAA